MAEPTLDSLSTQLKDAPVGSVPPTGPGSKTPATSPLGGGTPIGGSPPIKPIGEPGAPTKDSVDAPTPLDQDSFKGLVDDVYAAMDDAKVLAKNSEEILNYLLENKWSEKRLRDLSKYLKTSIKQMILSIKKHVKKDGVNETIDLIKKKINNIQSENVSETPAPGMPPMTPNLAGPPGAAMGAGTGLPLTPPPPTGGPGVMASSSDIRTLTDVDLEKISKRGSNMSKVIIKDGAVVDSSAYAKELIDKLSDSIRSVKTSIKKYDDVKVKYAGALALKQAIEEVGGSAITPGGGIGAGADMDLGPGTMGDEGGEGGDSKKLDTIIEKLDTMSGDIAELKGNEEEVGDELEGDTDVLGDVTDEAEKESEGIPGKDGKDVMSMVEEARIVIATAKSKLRENITASFEDMIKAKKEKADKKDEKKEDKKDKDASIDIEDLIRKVKARIEEIRTEKEANLYPFKKEIKPIPPVDNINAETAGKQISTDDKEIKGQPVTDKDMENINHGDIGQKDLSYSQGKADPGKTTEKKVSIEVAERIRKHSVQNAIDKARLSVELASRQQLKGMIDDPLRVSLAKNIVEAGIDPEIADAIIHNAYIDAYEESHKSIMKEAFDTFMEKDFDEFTKIAKFVDDYKVKQAEISSVENTEESFRDKEASDNNAPLRGFSADKDSRKEMYREYWTHVSNNRGIVKG